MGDWIIDETRSFYWARILNPSLIQPYTWFRKPISERDSMMGTFGWLKSGPSGRSYLQSIGFHKSKWDLQGVKEYLRDAERKGKFELVLDGGVGKRRISEFERRLKKWADENSYNVIEVDFDYREALVDKVPSQWFAPQRVFIPDWVFGAKRKR